MYLLYLIWNLKSILFIIFLRLVAICIQSLQFPGPEPGEKRGRLVLGLSKPTVRFFSHFLSRNLEPNHVAKRVGIHVADSNNIGTRYDDAV